MAGRPGPQPINQRPRDQKQPQNGMAQPLEIRYLAIGRIVRAHGIRGEVSMTVLTEFPERFETTKQVYLGNEFEAIPYTLLGHRWNKQNLLLRLEGITDRTQAEQLRNQYVQVPVEDAVPLPEGEFYLYQLVGLKVVSLSGELLGYIVDVLETGANDVYVVETIDQKQLLLPATDDVVKVIDLDQGQMTVELMDGLI